MKTIFNKFILTTVSLLIAVAPAFSMEVIHDKIHFESLADFDFCQTKGHSTEICEEALQRWVEKTPSEALAAGKKVRLTLQAWVSLKYFNRLTLDKQKLNCQDQDIALAVISGLNQKVTEHPDAVQTAKNIGFNLCFPQMKKLILENSQLGSELLVNTCDKLIEKKLISGLKVAKCKSRK